MQDAELLRYSRHILLEEIGIEGQERISASRALIVGAGGLGSPVAMYLAACGVGHISLVDDDKVDLTNLQRQIAHNTDSVGIAKVDSAARTLKAINPLIQVHAHALRASGEWLQDAVRSADVVIDCTDNFLTRHEINRACVTHKKPLVSGAVIRFDGQISVFDASLSSSPCYACLFPPEAQYKEQLCSTMGVFAPLVGVIGCMQAAEALKILCKTGDTLVGRLLMLDGRSMQWSEIRLNRNPSCSVCGDSGDES